MSFSVRDAQSGLEYNGTSLNSLFAQRRNLMRPSFYRMIRDILRFNRQGTELAAAWKDAFDAFLRDHPPAAPHDRRPFDVRDD